MTEKIPNKKQVEEVVSNQEKLGQRPYIFNNYEGTLPKEARGYYKSYIGSVANEVTERPKDDGILLTIDLTGVKSKKEVIERFYNKFGFNPVNTESWDSLGDYLWFLKESSAIFQQINPKAIHIRVININHIWSFSEKDYGILCEILTTTMDNSRFDDGLFLSFEVQNYA